MYDEMMERCLRDQPVSTTDLLEEKIRPKDPGSDMEGTTESGVGSDHGSDRASQHEDSMSEQFYHTDVAALAPAAAPDMTESASSLVEAWSAEDIRRNGVHVRYLGLTIDGFTSLMPSALRVQVVCNRCMKPCDVMIENRGITTLTKEVSCPLCKQALALRVAPCIISRNSATVAHALGVSCHLTELLRCDFEAVCGECTDVAHLPKFGPGARKNSTCMCCFAKHHVAVEGVELLGTAVAKYRQLAAESARRAANKQLAKNARYQDRGHGIVVGQPLPSNGTCKHFHKSNRWLRFPCCGRTFPCPKCHDEQADHPCKQANRMICGFCSHEQPCGEECSRCRAGQTRTKSAYWNGGQGNRSQAMMALADSHKHRGSDKPASGRGHSGAQGHQSHR